MSRLDSGKRRKAVLPSCLCSFFFLKLAAFTHFGGELVLLDLGWANDGMALRGRK
jgi:hypothetical protein